LLAGLVCLVLASASVGLVAPAASAQGANLEVGVGVGEGTVAGQAYLPGTFTVAVGDTVTFTIGSGDPHTITFGTGPEDVAPDAWPVSGFDAEAAPLFGAEPVDLGAASYDGTSFVNTSILGPAGSTATVEFGAPGTFPYFCAIHPGMAGEVTVVESGDVTTQEQADAAAAETSEALLSQVDPLREARAAAVSATDNADGTQTHNVFADASSEVGPQPGGGTGLMEVTEFVPADIQVAAGDTISWTASRAHTVTFVPEGTDPATVFPAFEAVFVPLGGSTYDGSAPVNSGVFNIPGPDGTVITEYSLTFPTEGTYPLFCAIHAPLGQLGTVTVGPAASG
jgi:plastocyanin